MAKLASFKAMQELIEPLTDIAAMMTKDLALNPRDDYSNFSKLREEGVFNEQQEQILIEANGLRNRLIHTYNGIDDQRAMNSFQSLYQGLQEILQVMEKWTKNFEKTS